MDIMQNGRKMLENRLKRLKFALLQRILMSANVIWMQEKQDYKQQQYTEELSFGKELNYN